MKIKLTSVYVDDQDKALRFYTEVLGLAKKADFSQGPFRWLTVTSPEDPDGAELQLALNNNPCGQGVPAGDVSTASAGEPCSSPTTSRATTRGSRRATAPISPCRLPT